MIDQSQPRESRGLINALRICTGTESDRRNQFIIAAGCIIWALGYVITNEAMSRGASVWLVVIPVVLAIGTFYAYLRFLRETDEYVRLLQYQGLALGFAIGILSVATLEALRKAGHSYDFADESATVMLLSWALAQFVVIWRHR